MKDYWQEKVPPPFSMTLPFPAYGLQPVPLGVLQKTVELAGLAGGQPENTGLGNLQSGRLLLE